MNSPNEYLILGTKHASFHVAENEANARDKFHTEFKGESIQHIASSYGILQELRLPWEVSRQNDFNPRTGTYIGEKSLSDWVFV